jgi:hypothetical protein
MNEEFAQSIITPELSAPPTGKLFPQAPSEIEHDGAYEDFKASQAIEGLPVSETADKLELIERLYRQWSSEGAVSVPLPYRDWKAAITGRVKLTRAQIVQLASDPVKIFRQEIKELALALGKALNDKKALSSLADIGQAHIQAQKRDQELRSFLMEHFEEELMVATARNVPLHRLAMDIMLRGRSRNFEGS